MVENRIVACWYCCRNRIFNGHRKKLEQIKMKIVNILLEKLSENSTWRGLILIATAVGVRIEPELQEAILVAGLGLVGLINVIRKG